MEDSGGCDGQCGRQRGSSRFEPSFHVTIPQVGFDSDALPFPARSLPCACRGLRCGYRTGAVSMPRTFLCVAEGDKYREPDPRDA